MAFAGHDTTYMSLGTAMMYLAKYPAIQEAIVQEVKAFKEPLDFDELKNAPVLNSFLAESWRICPPIGGGYRRLTEPMEYNGYKYPKGQLFSYSNHVAFANDKLYPEPSKFSISRFLPQDHPLLDDPKLHATDIDFNSMKAEYPNFGGGNHACLGAHFAKLELRILVARMLQGFNVEVRNCKKKQVPIYGWTNEFRLTPVE
jgi:cytochrome P450